MDQLFRQLEDPNTKCRIYLSKLLFDRIITPLPASGGATGRPSAAMFAAFDPWQTCWRFPPGSCRFFDAAEKNGLISSDEAIFLSQTLIQQAADLSAIYEGQFKQFFQDPNITMILAHIHDLENLARSGLAISGSWIDRLFEACPWPLQPKHHLDIKSFSDVTIEDLTQPYSATPWLAWVEALDLACLGPYLGLKSSEILSIIKGLKSNVKSDQVKLPNIPNRILAKRVSIPLFSFGLQGFVTALFREKPEDERLALSMLLQFGQSLADEYALLRMRRFKERYKIAKSLQELSREVLLLFSPIGKILLSKSGERAGYGLITEHDYWAGYRHLEPSEMAEMSDNAGITIELPGGINAYIEPVPNSPYFHKDFARMRLLSCFACVDVALKPNTPGLPLHEVQQLRADLGHHINERPASIAKLRQYYVTLKVEENWIKGQARINNGNLKEFLQKYLQKTLKSGYQISSFTAEVEQMFVNKISVSKSRNGLTLSWNGSY